MEIPKAVKNFELPQAVKNIDLPAAMKNIELPASVKNNIEMIPEAMKNIDFSNAMKNVPNALREVPNAVMNTQVPIFSAFATSAFTSVASLTKNIQQKVEQTAKEFQQQHQEFIKEVKEETHESKVGTEAIPPWAGLPNEEELKEQIMALSQDKRNFTIPPPENTNFQFELHVYYQTAMAALQADPKLNRMRFELVPAIVPEPTFWRNYFYRISLIKQTSLGSMEDTVLKKEVYSKDVGDKDLTIVTREINEKASEIIEVKEKDEASSTNSEILFDASSKSGDDSDAWIDEFAKTTELEGVEDGEDEFPENWEEQLKEQLKE
ncbi:1638_t:CDS:2 [Diversispora eburnea]|uniref:1638_t:CDS:1 n=1 Tax=Diversispora eburnea TaxID=1213867 RepID=A0A9N8VRQ1_9GLOM|nr:1638_t:CDS:2 [Diversispora eburnea]